MKLTGPLTGPNARGRDVPRICLAFPNSSSFVDADRRILSERFDVVPVQYGGKKDVLELGLAVARSKLTIAWFALGHADVAVGLCRFLRRRSIVVLGGWDVAAMEEIPYGAMLARNRVRRTKSTLMKADLVLAVSEANRLEGLQWVDREILVLPLGIDVGFFAPEGSKEPLVVSVAGVGHEATIRTKGVDVIFAVARDLPQAQFMIVGVWSPEWKDRLARMAPENVSILGWVDQLSLREIYRRARVYVQLSAHESFGMALAEAMACECSPVVSDRGSLPEIVGSSGSVVPYGDVRATAAAVSAALGRTSAPDARDHIATSYPLSRRRVRLLELCESMV